MTDKDACELATNMVRLAMGNKPMINSLEALSDYGNLRMISAYATKKGWTCKLQFRGKFFELFLVNCGHNTEHEERQLLNNRIKKWVK